MTDQMPTLSAWPARGEPRAVALVLHGGAERGRSTVRPWRLAYLRMVPVAKAVHQAGLDHGVEVRLLRNRLRGWNEPALDPVRDARWALDRIRAERPGLPVVIIGHSMGGRAALRVADDPAVVGVCALAPWTPDAEPVEPVRGRSVLIAHGVRDRMTDPAESYSYARRADAGTARLARFELAEEGHAMLRRSKVWNRLAGAFTLDALGLARTDELLSAVWEKPDGDRLRIPL